MGASARRVIRMPACAVMLLVGASAAVCAGAAGGPVVEDARYGLGVDTQQIQHQMQRSDSGGSEGQMSALVQELRSQQARLHQLQKIEHSQEFQEMSREADAREDASKDEERRHEIAEKLAMLRTVDW